MTTVAEGQNIEQEVEPVNVERLAQELDLNDPRQIILDDKGQVRRIVTNEGDPIDSDYEQKPVDKTKQTPDNKNTQTNEEEGNNEEEEEEEDDEPVSDGFERDLLTALGVKQVKVGDTVIPLENLKPVQHRALLNQRIKEIQEFLPKNKEEADILTYLRNGKTQVDLAKHILENDPKARISLLTNEQIVKERIRKDNPEYTDEEVDSEYGLLSEALVERKANLERQRAESQKVDLSKPIQDENTRLRTEYDSQSKELEDEIDTIETIDGLPIDDNIRNIVLNDRISEAFDKDSQLVADLQNKEKMIYTSFWRTIGPQWVAQLQKQLENAEEKAYQRYLNKLPKNKKVDTTDIRKDGNIKVVTNTNNVETF